MTLTIYQLIVSGIFGLLAALATGYFAYQQATKVAGRAADASIEVKRLEVGDTEKARLQARVAELEKRNDDLCAKRDEWHVKYENCERERVTALNTGKLAAASALHELGECERRLRETQQRLEGTRFIEQLELSPERIREFADQIERAKMREIGEGLSEDSEQIAK